MSFKSLSERKKQFLEDCCGGAAPTMSGGDGMYTSASPAEGPTSGFDPMLGGKRKKKGVMDRVKKLKEEYKRLPVDKMNRQIGRLASEPNSTKKQKKIMKVRDDHMQKHPEEGIAHMLDKEYSSKDSIELERDRLEDELKVDKHQRRDREHQPNLKHEGDESRVLTDPKKRYAKGKKTPNTIPSRKLDSKLKKFGVSKTPRKTRRSNSEY